jgi:hypothetical protein
LNAGIVMQITNIKEENGDLLMNIFENLEKLLEKYLSADEVQKIIDVLP